ncbi:MAG: hypothetical protein RLZZ74_3465 [Cyanobacteriota bacterium]|jgi:hypothetical protein
MQYGCDKVAILAYSSLAQFQRLSDTGGVTNWNNLAQLDRDIVIKQVSFVELNPDADAISLHDIYVKAYVADGWKRGFIRNVTTKTNPWLIPYDLLPERMQKNAEIILQTAKIYLKLI